MNEVGGPVVEGDAGGDGDRNDDSDSEDDSEDPDGDGSGDDAGDGSAAVETETLDSHAGGSVAAHSLDVDAKKDAMQLLYKKAMADKDDHMLKVLRKKLMDAKLAEKEASTDVARALGKRLAE